MLSFQLKTGKDESWLCRADVLHRRGAKSVSAYWGSGTNRHLAYLVNGLLHNPEGLSYRSWGRTGKPLIDRYHLFGKSKTKSEWEEQRCSVSN